MNALASLSPAVLALLAKEAAAAAKAARPDLSVGAHEVSEVVSLALSGEVRCGEDYDSKIVAKACPWKLLAVALSKLNGVTVDSIVAESEAIAAGDVKTIKKSAADAIAAIKAPTEKRCAGKVTVTKDSAVSVIVEEAVLAA
jgi:hypothetical protein